MKIVKIVEHPKLTAKEYGIKFGKTVVGVNCRYIILYLGINTLRINLF